MVAWGTMSALNILAWTYYWEFSATEVSLILALPSLLAIGLVMFTLGPISKRFEKHQQLRVALIVMILDLLWLYPLKLFGFLPEDSPGLDFFLNFIFMVVFIYCYLFRAISSYSIISDISDEHEWNYGVRQEAGFFAVMNFIAKFSLIIGPIYAGIALDVIDLTQGVLPGAVPLETQNGLVYAMGIGVLPALLFAVYFVGRLKLGRAQVEDYQERLKARSEQRSGA
jgi:GPH family glycoside/pentoside/hexuronide:cation symporter